MSNIMKEQNQVSRYRGLPVDSIGASQTIVDISGETAQLYYYNSGVLTPDAGQAAGVVVVAQLANAGIKNELGSMCATDRDTSLSFTSTALTTEKPFPFIQAEAMDSADGESRANTITAGLNNGEYVVDYVNGIIYGKKASTATNLTSVSYKIQKEITGSGGGASEDVNITAIGGNAVTTSIPVTFGAASTLTTGSKTVAVAGTAEVLAASTTVKSVVIQADVANTGTVHIGDSTVNNATNPGITLYAGDSIEIAVDNLNDIYVDVSVNGESVNYNYTV